MSDFASKYGIILNNIPSQASSSKPKTAASLFDNADEPQLPFPMSTVPKQVPPVTTPQPVPEIPTIVPSKPQVLSSFPTLPAFSPAPTLSQHEV